MNWLMARLYDRMMVASEDACLRAWRSGLLSPLQGDVLEVGAGTGLNMQHYGDGVQRLVLAEPNENMRRQLEERVRAKAGAEVADHAMESLPYEDRTFDAVVSTLVLCSVADPGRALREAHRVLKDGGTFVFLEHVAAEDRPDRLRWQRRIEPLWKLIAGNCHLTRRTLATIEGAGFEIQSVERESIRKAMPLVRPSVRGVAVRV